MLVRAIATLALGAEAALRLGEANSWSYGLHGDDWGGICTAATSKVQSPVDFAKEYGVAKPPVNMYYRYPPLSQPLEVVNTGRSLAITLPGTWFGGFGMGLDLGKATQGTEAFRLWQMNFHAPAEHLIKGIRYPLEVQMVHKHSASTDLAVISILFETNDESFSEFLHLVSGKHGLPKKSWDIHPANTVPFVAERPFPTEQDPRFSEMFRGAAAPEEDPVFLAYNGSSTTPPCQENVRYYVRQKAIGASLDQLNMFKEAIYATNSQGTIPGNFRNVQQLDGRVPVLVQAKDYFDTRPPAQLSADVEEEAEVDFSAGVSADDLQQSKEFSEVLGTDTPEEIKMKGNLKNAAQDCQASQAAAREAKMKLDETEAADKTAPGVVEKIDLMWKKIEFKNQLAKTGAKAVTDCEVYKKIIAKAGKLFMGKAKPTTTLPPAKVAFGGIPITLPDGAVGNPFNPSGSVAEFAPRQEARFLRPHLQMADGPSGVVPDAQVDLPTPAPVFNQSFMITTTTLSPHAVQFGLDFGKELTPEEKEAMQTEIQHELNATVQLHDPGTLEAIATAAPGPAVAVTTVTTTTTTPAATTLAPAPVTTKAAAATTTTLDPSKPPPV
mmetsp:Transcript_31591/g.66812  ORF Transcript_31591/g.66812 Transcript_31591/m.66812 type:complete len:609 (+) Transcript_31591:150-1976(+)